jgi:hypothetical protein
MVDKRKQLTAFKHSRLFFSISNLRHSDNGVFNISVHGCGISFHGRVLMGWAAHLHLVETLRRYHFAYFYDDSHDLSSYHQLHYPFSSTHDDTTGGGSWVLFDSAA